MSPAEAQPWIAGLKQVTGFDWDHRIDHMARDEFRTVSKGLELHLWSNGRWAVFEVGTEGIGVTNSAKKDFQVAIEQLKRAYVDRLALKSHHG